MTFEFEIELICYMLYVYVIITITITQIIHYTLPKRSPNEERTARPLTTQ